MPLPRTFIPVNPLLSVTGMAHNGSRIPKCCTSVHSIHTKPQLQASFRRCLYAVQMFWDSIGVSQLNIVLCFWTGKRGWQLRAHLSGNFFSGCSNILYNYTSVVILVELTLPPNRILTLSIFYISCCSGYIGITFLCRPALRLVYFKILGSRW